MQEPIWSLDMALNNESIVGADLVAWVSMGIQHVPRAEVYFLVARVQTPCFLLPHE